MVYRGSELLNSQLAHRLSKVLGEEISSAITLDNGWKFKKTEKLFQGFSHRFSFNISEWESFRTACGTAHDRQKLLFS